MIWSMGAAVAISGFTGWCLVGVLWPRADTTLRGLVGLGLGLSLSSFGYLLALTLFDVTRASLLAVDISLLTGALTALYFDRHARLYSSAESKKQMETPAVLTKLVAVVFFVTAILAAASLQTGFQQFSLGWWDAWAMWNIKARFLFLEHGEHWQRLFSELLRWASPGYPLLLPATVARGWVYVGETVRGVPGAISALFTILSVALVFGTLKRLHGSISGMTAALALLATPFFLQQGSWQIADIPLGCLFAMSLSVLLFARFEADPIFEERALLLAGLMIGSAAWTKNEGILMSLAMFLAISFTEIRREDPGTFRRLVFFASGAAAPLAAVLITKSSVVAAPAVATRLSFDAFFQILDPARHATLLAALADLAVVQVGLPLALSLLILTAALGRTDDLKQRRALMAPALTLLVTLCGYYVIYLTSQDDLGWILKTSSSRLFQHLWPSALLLLFAWLRSPITLFRTVASIR